MKKENIRHRWLALFLALVLILSLSPLALAEDNEGEDDDSNTDPPANDTIVITSREAGYSLGNPINPNDTVTLRAAMSSGGSPAFTWSTDSDVISIEYNRGAGVSAEAKIKGNRPGTATITVTANGVSSTPLKIDVSGIAVPEGMNTITILENGSKTLVEGTDFVRYGAAKGDGTIVASFISEKSSVARVSGGDTTSWSGLSITGITEGNARVTLTATAGSKPLGGSAEYSVIVESNQAPPIPGKASNSAPLRFSTILSQIAAQCNSLISGSTLVSVTGLNVPTTQGTLYLNYKSTDDTGSGVGSALTYYASGEVGPYLKDIVFVPNPAYTGGKAMITFTGNAKVGDGNEIRTFKGRIEVTIEATTTNITLTASPESPAKFTGSAFGEVCQRQTGAPLSYVMFTLPPATQGILYEGYVSDSDYTARVTANEQYNQTALNDLTFVPTPGYVGMVDIGYAGYSATGIRYNGELRINVTQSLDESIIYRDGGTGSVYLSESDFSAYCVNVTGGRLGYVKFTPPAASQGTLYRSWRNGRGTAVTADDEFSTASQINQLYFVATDGFHGTVRVPFSGEDRNGVPFTGTMEIHIQSGGAGDIAYTCTPGGSVKFTASDFNDMSLKLTGQRLHYITFQTLPNYTDGAFYHNRTSANAMGESVSRDARYYNSSAPYLMNLSFWASDSFRGSIEIPFTGCAVSGETFSGLLVISSSNSTGSSNVVSYDTMGRQSVLFNAGDFDKVSLAATNSSLNYVRFNLPSSGEGILYFDYNPSATPVTISSTDSLYQSGEATISKVTFLPAYNFSGTVRIPFSGWAISGAQFQGTVEITVRPAATNTTVRYTTRGEPVTFTTYEFQGTGGNQLRSIRLDQLPSASSGKLYYQYTCPTKYSWVAVAGTEYYLGNDPQVSNLTFLPKAGFVGTATIPYTATNTDGTQFTGQISIIVDSTTTSSHFIDLGSCSSEAMASIDFLYSRRVVNGTGDDKYSPELPIRRGDFCLMIYRAFQFSADGAVSLFTDVADDAYYAQAIRVLRSQGIVDGVGNNRFQPNANISRQDAALMVQRTLRAAGMSAADGSSSLLSAYSDGDKVSNYAQGAMACLIQGDMLPSSWSRLWPTNALTRADMAVLLHRAITQ